MIFLKKDELLGRHCFNVLKVFDFLAGLLEGCTKKETPGQTNKIWMEVYQSAFKASKGFIHKI